MSEDALRKASQFRINFEKELQAFRQGHPTARVPEDRMPELIAYGEGLKLLGEMATFKPEDFNKRVIERGESSLIQHGVNMIIIHEARRHPNHGHWLFVRKLVRSLIRRVDVQFAYVEG
jgi:hypothetical protein